MKAKAAPYFLEQLLIIFTQLAFFICSLSLSEIIAINSLLVGLPLSL
jgi:hypothetical protein